MHILHLVSFVIDKLKRTTHAVAATSTGTYIRSMKHRIVSALSVVAAFISLISDASTNSEQVAANAAFAIELGEGSHARFEKTPKEPDQSDKPDDGLGRKVVRPSGIASTAAIGELSVSVGLSS